MLEVMDTYSGGWNILVIAICECISLGYCYGKIPCGYTVNGQNLIYCNGVFVKLKPL